MGEREDDDADRKEADDLSNGPRVIAVLLLEEAAFTHEADEVAVKVSGADSSRHVTSFRWSGWVRRGGNSVNRKSD